MTSFAGDFAVSCAYLRLSDDEKQAAWESAHYRTSSPKAKAVRIYRAIAGSLSMEELAAIGRPYGLTGWPADVLARRSA